MWWTWLQLAVGARHVTALGGLRCHVTLTGETRKVLAIKAHYLQWLAHSAARAPCDIV